MARALAVRSPLAVLALVMAASAGPKAQSVPGPPPDSASTTLPRTALDDLPSSGTLGGLLETTIPQLISDRIDGGGLSVGRESRLGAQGSSWTQAAFLFDQVDLTDPGVFGASLLFLDPAMFDAIVATTAMMPIDYSASGLSVRLIPSRPPDAWRGRVDVLSTLSPAPRSTAAVPPAATLRSWKRFAASAGGPVRRGRIGAMFGLTATSATQYERADPTMLHAGDVGGFGQLLFTPSVDDEVFVAVAARSAHVPADARLWIGQPDAREDNGNVLMAAHWTHRAENVSWTMAGGFAHATIDRASTSASLAYIDSIRDLPIMQAASGARSPRRWTALVRETGCAGATNRWLRGQRAGVEIGAGSDQERTPLTATVGETVEGVPARIWQIASTAPGSRHHATAVTAFAEETIPLSSRLTVYGGVRWEGVAAAAEGGEMIRWSNWFPRASLRWEMLPSQHLTGLLGLARNAHRLPLDDLAYGDPRSPGAEVFRWDDRDGDGRFDAGEDGPLVARVGDRPPGTSSIDPHLERPYVDELMLGMEFRPSAAWSIRFFGLTRRERRLIAPVNTGAPLDAYRVSTVPDAGGDELDPSDDQQLPVYDRRPDTFGADAYVLTNPPVPRTTFEGLEVSLWHTGDRLWMMAGATAGRVSGPAAARGFRVFQNDGALPTDAFVDPNASTFVRGSLFSDRAFTIKTSGTWRFDHGVRLGIVARYQDGQPFSRLVIARDLDQGTEAVRAYRNGRTRFAYTLTLDTRVQVGLGVTRQHVALVWDTFNLLNLSNEVEESVATGPGFRAPTATQPPRAMHVGMRVTF